VLTQEGRSVFPYNDWFRGEYISEIPIIAEREAGFRPIIEKERVKYYLSDMPYPQHCFRSGLKTNYPCYPECTHENKKHDPYIQRYGKVFLYS
jgi:hypothetical protein